MHNSKKSSTFAANFENLRFMLATPTKERDYVPMSPNYESEVYYTRDEFMDELAKQLGHAYGMNDIREAC